MISHLGEKIFLYIHTCIDSYPEDMLYKELLQIHKKKSINKIMHKKVYDVPCQKKISEWPINIEKGAQQH